MPLLQTKCTKQTLGRSIPCSEREDPTSARRIPLVVGGREEEISKRERGGGEARARERSEREEIEPRGQECREKRRPRGALRFQARSLLQFSLPLLFSLVFLFFFF
ncbi:unnamed protein product, partial [Musa banksii]